MTAPVFELGPRGKIFLLEELPDALDFDADLPPPPRDDTIVLPLTHPHVFGAVVDSPPSSAAALARPSAGMPATSHCKCRILSESIPGAVPFGTIRP